MTNQCKVKFHMLPTWQRFLLMPAAALVAAAAAAAPAAAGGKGQAAGLAVEHRAAFCGVEGYEAHQAYSTAVVKELKRREAASAGGARSTKDVLAEMTREYCDARGVRP